MCRLLGIFSENEVELPGDIWYNFLNIAKNDGVFNYPHRDGWGAAWISRDKVNYYKNLTPIWESRMPPNMIGDSFVIHARKATIGEPAIENTHPFIMEDVLLVHNGDLQLAVNPKRKTIGKTDSEKYLALLLDLRDEMGEMEQAIAESLKYIEDFSALNLIIGSMEDETFWVLNFYNHIDEAHDKHYTMFFSKSNSKMIVSSEPLTSEGWNAISTSALDPILIKIPRKKPNDYEVVRLKSLKGIVEKIAVRH